MAIEIDEQNHEGQELVFEEERQEALEIKLVLNSLELIQVMQKEVMIQTMNVVKYKYLSVRHKNKRKRQHNKRKRHQIKKTKR